MYKFQKNAVKYDIRPKSSFTEGVVNFWNCLPSLIVEAPSLDCFKTPLDRFWSNQDALYDFKFLGTGSRGYS